MKLADALATLEKMKRKMETTKPAWYETSSEEEKLSFDTWNKEKVEALGCAIKCVKASEKLRKAHESIGDFLNEVE